MKKILLFSFFCILFSVKAQEPMITEWKFTDSTVTELYTRGFADYIIKDASDQVVSSGSLTGGSNTISVPGTGTYTMEISNSSNFAFKGIDDDSNDDIFPKEMTKLLNWGNVDLNENLSGMFANSEIQITAPDLPDFKPNTSLNRMFSLSLAFTGDLSGWDVSKVIDMSSLFDNASSFTSDLSSWDVSNATNMFEMFGDAHSFTSDLSGWDVSAATEMSGMFAGASSFTSDLSGWDVSNVTRMNGMFFYATSFASDLSNWDVSNVTVMGWMFMGVPFFTSDLSGWDISNVTNMNSMFNDSGMTCDDYSQTLIGWSNQDVNSEVTLGAESLQFGPLAVDSRNLLINDKGWIITGDTYVNACSLGIDDMSLASDIRVINPVNETIQLITDEKIDKVTVYDTSGKKVKEFKGTTASAAYLPRGTYILMIQTANGTQSIKVLKE